MSGTITRGPLVDLRAFAAEQAFPRSTDWSEARVGAPVPDGEMRVEALLLRRGSGVATARASEIVLVLAGTLSLSAETVTVRLEAGEAAGIPMGMAFHWRAGEDVRAIVLSSERPGPQHNRLTRIDLAAPHLPSAKPNVDLLVGDKDPQCAQNVDFRTQDGGFYAGTWSSTPYHRLPMTYGHWEAMYLLDGDVAFGDADGNETMVTPGDFVLIPAGEVASWRGIGPTRKLFVILR